MSGALTAFVFGGSTSTSTLNVTVLPVNAFATGFGAGTLTTLPAVGSSTGVPPFSYAWTIVSGDTITINSPTAASTTFSTTLSYGQTKFTIVRLTVTDAYGATGSADITVVFSDVSIDIH